MRGGVAVNNDDLILVFGLCMLMACAGALVWLVAVQR